MKHLGVTLFCAAAACGGPIEAGVEPAPHPAPVEIAPELDAIETEVEPVEVEPEVEAPSVPLAPLAGIWSVDSRQVHEDGCGGMLGADQTEPGEDTFDLIVTGEDAFTIKITFDDGDEYDVDCVTEAGTFRCEGARDVYRISDTTLSVAWVGGGELLSDSELTTTLDATALCDGSLCDVAGAFLEAELPCEGSMSMRGRFADTEPG